MAQIGTARFRHGGVTYDIPVFNTGDVDYPFFRVNVNGTIGAVPMYPLSDNPTHDYLRVYHNNTVYGLHDKAKVGTIDDFNDGSLSEYGTTNNNFSVSATAAYEGAYGLEDTSSSVSYIYSESGLNAYPSQGSRFRVYIYPHWSSNPLWRVYFAVTTGAMSGGGGHTPDDGYRLNCDETGFNFQVEVDGVDSGVDGTSTNFSWTQDTWYYVDILWDDGTMGGNAGDLKADVYRASDDTLMASSTRGNDTSHTSGGVGFWCNGNMVGTYFDDYRILE